MKKKRQSKEEKKERENIQEAIDRDKNIGSYGLRVDETSDTVRVTGIVDTLNEKEHIKELVKGLAGNKDIDLAVSISTDGAIDDEDVVLEVAEEIADHKGLEGKVTVNVQKGVVELKGDVEKKELKKEAVEAASKARGVTKVINNIKIKEEDIPGEGEDIFHSQVRNDKE